VTRTNCGEVPRRKSDASTNRRHVLLSESPMPPPGSENPGSFSVSLPPRPENSPRDRYETSSFRRASDRSGWSRPHTLAMHAFLLILRLLIEPLVFPGHRSTTVAPCGSSPAHNIFCSECLYLAQAAHAAPRALSPRAQCGPGPLLGPYGSDTQRTPCCSFRPTNIYINNL
jgi:hypothetical protein